ncbi:MAG: MBOAT family protein [Clostridia bacterium]|nr:MBOAT family protein [Clostridia bacterium]
MVFSGLTFLLLFFPVVITLVLLSGNIRYQNGILLAASLIFYAWGEPKWILAMIAVTAVNYFCALPMQKDDLSPRWKKVLLILGITSGLGLLFWFKYCAFFVNAFGSLFHQEKLMEKLPLPIGISFYTFQALTYTVDVYRGKARVQNNPFKLLLYVSCFPQLIAGPIVQYADIEQQLDHRTISKTGYILGFRRFTLGLAKKVLLANLCGSALSAFGTADTTSMTVLGAWISAILYGLQIYFDFSAYSDMAIGIGRMLGFIYKENFDYPYLSASITEFWRRWHMSLGAFFRDYVYIPLGGNRKGTVRLVLNLLIVWGLTGLWHGASWNFLIWGLFYGILLIIEKLVLGKKIDTIPAVIRHIVTLFFVLIGWVLFYYEDISFAWTHLLAMFGMTAENGAVHVIPVINEKQILLMGKYGLVILVMMFFSTPACRLISDRWKKRDRQKRCGFEPAAGLISILLLALSVITLIGQSYNPFIYFRF